MTCPIFKSEGFGSNTLEPVITMWSKLPLYKIESGSLGRFRAASSRATQGISLENTHIAETDINADRERLDFDGP